MEAHLWVFGKKHWGSGVGGMGRIGGIGRVEKMANGNMADGKCAGRVSEAVIEGKAAEKTGALQKLRWFGAAFRIRRSLFACDLAQRWTAPGGLRLRS